MLSQSVSRDDADLEKGLTHASFEEAVNNNNNNGNGGVAGHNGKSGRLNGLGRGGSSSPSGERLVHTISVDGDLVHLGDNTYRRSELVNAFAGELNPGIHPRPPQNLANPVPLGLASFSYCCLVLSLLNAQVRGVSNAKIIISASLFFGGCIELFAGLLCYPVGNTYAMTVFGAFGGFWISYGCILTDQFGILSSYADDPEMLANALGFFLTGWTVFTFLMLMCTLKSTWGLFLLLFFLELTFLMLTIGTFISNEHVTKAGGYFGILSSMCGFYSLYSGVADTTNSYFPVRAYFMPNAPTV